MSTTQTKLTKTFLVTGIAGSGKTRTFQDRIKIDPSYGVLAATTGVAAMNLGAQTIHSFMGYSDLDDMRRTVKHVGFARKLQKRYEEGSLWPGAFVVIDEKSMLNAEQLDVTFEAFERFNHWLTYAEDDGSRFHLDEDPRPSPNKYVGIALVGDFCQLPPVEGEFAFKAECWPLFEENRINLSGSYRQTSGSFIDALNLARKGDGAGCVSLLQEMHVEFSGMANMTYPGTTVFGTNKDVNWYNAYRYGGLASDEVSINCIRDRQQKKEWLRDELVPNVLKLKIGARVMITANEPRTFRYANGDMGEILAFSENSKTNQIDRVTVKLDRKDANGAQIVVEVNFIKRDWIDPQWHGPSWKAIELGKTIGSVLYMPLKLAYALTVHKCQGLSLSNVQYNISHPFTGGPAMSYVALSRCRTPEGLRIIGDPRLLAGRINVHPEVSKWL